jgi:anti-anti-sigma regulatory factor
MIGLLVATLIVLVLETALATFVATRAWDARPARLFVPVAAGLALLNIDELLRQMPIAPAAIYAASVVSTLAIAALQLALLLFFSALFTPEWWEGARLIRWIALPYVLALAALAIDLVGRLGLIFRGLVLVDGAYRLATVRPGAAIMLGLFVAGWLVVLAILGAAFARSRANRPAIALLFAAIVLASAVGLLVGRFSGLERAGGLFQSLFVIGALAYAVLRTRLFTPTRAALDLAIASLGDAVAVRDQAGQIIYANPQASALGIRSAALAPSQAHAGWSELADLLATADRDGRAVERTLTLGQRQIDVSATPVADPRGRTIGLLLLGRDVTEVARRNAELEQERARLAQTVEALEAGQRERDELSATVRGLSLPLIPVLEGVLVLPLIGAFDSERIEAFVGVLLAGVERERAHLVLIDVTGIPLLDAAAAAGLLRGVRAAALLGARSVLVGIRPEIAEALVALGVPLDQVSTAATLRQALAAELRLES